jgi:hypothetical protein
MKRALGLVICLLLFSAGWGFGQQTRFSKTGQSWKSLDGLDRSFYVSGFRDGYQDGVRDVHGLAATLSLEEMKSFWGDGTPVVPGVPEVSGPGPLPVPEARELSRHVTAGLGVTHQTNGQIADAVSSLYMDFRNMPICWDSAIVLANESLLGFPPTDEELALTRAWDARFGCE